MVSDLIRPRGQHRLTYRKRVMAQTEFAIVVAFWGVVIAGSGFTAGWIWAQAMS